MFVAGFVTAMLALGWLMAGALAPGIGALERFGLAYGIGTGTFTFCIFLASLLGIPITLAGGIITYVLLLALCAFCLRRSLGTLFPTLRMPRLNVVQITLLTLIGVVLAITFAVAAYWPPYVWDSLAVWVLKGQVIAATGTLAELHRTGWPFYPLNISLQIAFLYLLGGDLLQLIFPLYLLSLAVLLIANLRPRAGSTIALASALFLIVTPIVQFQATIAYADLPFAFYYVGSAIYLYRFLTERQTAWLVISALLVGFAGWTRTEGPMYFAINSVTLVLFMRPLRETAKHFALYAGIFVVLWLPWTIYARLANYGDYFGYAPIGLIDAITGRLDAGRLGAILNFLGERSVATQDWGLLWIALPVAFLLGKRYWRSHASLIALLLLNLLAMIYAYYVASAQTYFSVEWWLATGFDRVTLHWIPLAAFYLGETVGAATVIYSHEKWSARQPDENN
ncbi:MAG TPA: glycosyltransferase family 39 protein [Anaerolineae bacterium]